MPPQHLAPVVAARLDAVFLDQVPDNLFERDSPRWQVRARERLNAFGYDPSVEV